MFKAATLMIIISFATQSFAQTNSASKVDKKESDKPTAEARDSDKLDIRKLEQKYWSAKDDDFSVVQNRRYTKAKRFYLNASGGIPFNDPFATGSLMSLQAGYFFNERVGIDLNYTKGPLKDNDAVEQFINRYATVPDRNIFSNSKIFSVTYVPLYAKMSFLDSSIIYFDMGFSAGVGSTEYLIKKIEGDELKSSFSYQWAINQQIFFSNHFAIRVELINRYTTEERSRYKAATAPPAPRDLGSKIVNDSSFLLGLTYWF